MRSETATTHNTSRRCWWQFSLILVLVLSGCVGPRPSETSTTAVETDIALGARMDAAATDALREIRAAGFSIAVVRDGQLVLAKGYGYADLAERVPASADTIYRLASITKQFTAAAILHLVEEGKLSLEDPISDYLPDYPATWPADHDPQPAVAYLGPVRCGGHPHPRRVRWRGIHPGPDHRPGRFAAARLRAGDGALV